MQRAVLTLFALGAVFGVLFGPAAAQLGTGLPECDRSYKDFWSQPVAAKQLTGAQLATVHRYALRAYDGCTSGDERILAGNFFERLAAIRGPAADQALQDLGKALAAK